MLGLSLSHPERCFKQSKRDPKVENSKLKRLKKNPSLSRMHLSMVILHAEQMVPLYYKTACKTLN